jgi:hypothetical protein
VEPLAEITQVHLDQAFAVNPDIDAPLVEAAKPAPGDTISLRFADVLS